MVSKNLLVTLLVAVVLAASSSEAQSTVQGTKVKSGPPSNCTGKITAVYCLEDSKGRLTQVAYRNTDTGLQNVGCSPSEDWTGRATKTYLLRPDESIIRVRSCRGKSGVFLNMTTDANRYLTCGLPPVTKPKNGTYDPTAALEAVDDMEETEDPTVTQDVEDEYDSDVESDASRRRLLADPGASTRYAKCMLSQPAKQPVWSNVTQWWTYNGANGNFGRVQSSDPYFTFFVDGNTNYWFDYNYYQLTRPGSAYYYDEVYPLAALNGQCSSKKHTMLKKLTGTCWNNRWIFAGNNTSQNLPIVFDTDLGETPGGAPAPCPQTQTEIDAFNAQLQEIGQRLVAASNGIISQVNFQPYSPALCKLTVGGNNTVTVAGQLVAGNGVTPAQVYGYLAGASVNNDLCTIQYSSQSICTGTQFPNIFYVAPTPNTPGGRRRLQMYDSLPSNQVSWRSM